MEVVGMTLNMIVANRDETEGSIYFRDPDDILIEITTGY